MDAEIERVLTTFTESARRAFGDALRSVALFGSAAEDRLRPVSDVNVLLVLRSFDPAAAEALRDELRLARAAVALRPMFVLDAELPDAVELFATKFADVARRRRVLFGDDPLAGLVASRSSRVRSLRRALLNLSMRLRERLVSVGEEGAADVLVEFAPPARAAAAEWLSLRDGITLAPREALTRAAGELAGPDVAAAVATASAAREGADVAPDAARDALLGLASLVARLSSSAAELAA
jgi:predicted nucleotidyltransferase